MVVDDPTATSHRRVVATTMIILPKEAAWLGEEAMPVLKEVSNKSVEEAMPARSRVASNKSEEEAMPVHRLA